MKYDAHFDSKLSSVLLQRLKFNFLSASLQWHIPPCTPSHTVFVLIAPLSFPQSLLLNYTLKWIKYYIYSPNIYCQQLCVIQASGLTPSFCLSLSYTQMYAQAHVLALVSASHSARDVDTISVISFWSSCHILSIVSILAYLFFTMFHSHIFPLLSTPSMAALLRLYHYSSLPLSHLLTPFAFPVGER